MSPDRRTCNQIDHLLVNRKFRTSVLDTRAIRSADIASGHHLVGTKLRLKLKAAPKRRGIRRTRYDTQKLENDEIRRQFCLELRECKNWRGVTLLPVVSKILGRIVIDRIRMWIDHRLRKEQPGFRSG